MARSGVRPQFVRKASDDWTLSKKNGASAQGADAPSSADVADPPPSVLGIDQYVNVDQAMPTDRIEFQDGDGKPVGAITDVAAIDHAAIHRALREVGPGAIFGPGELPTPTIRAQQLQLGAVDDPAIDQLWDWVRADRDGIMNFLGFIPDTSRFLFKWIENFQVLEGDAASWMRTIFIAGKMAGFVMLCPIKPNGQQLGVYVGDCHLYLSLAARGNVQTLLPMLTAEIDRLIPNVSLRVVTARDDEWARLLRGVGFTTQIVLTRPAASTGSPSGT